ncbi:unnamed protein product [Haemonchus placei]|uniref:Uncharacterized protein n=1 Tax=Haemonchus placei TaxID=6290 RepID=A0A3P7TRD0_HAEPC|nr:unnamed protein product [Haemonchus placei]
MCSNTTSSNGLLPKSATFLPAKTSYNPIQSSESFVITCRLSFKTPACFIDVAPAVTISGERCKAFIER